MGVAIVPVNVAPEISLDAVIPPVTATELPVIIPPLVELAVTFPAVMVPAVVTLSAVTVPVNTVLPTVEEPRLGSILETGSPLIVRFVQLIFVAATSTASMFFTTAFIVVGTYRGLCPHRLILFLVNITFFRR